MLTITITSINAFHNRVRYYRGRVSNFDQSEARKHCILASYLLKFETLPRKYRVTFYDARYCFKIIGTSNHNHVMLKLQINSRHVGNLSRHSWGTVWARFQFQLGHRWGTVGAKIIVWAQYGKVFLPHLCPNWNWERAHTVPQLCP